MGRAGQSGPGATSVLEGRTTMQPRLAVFVADDGAKLTQFDE